MLFEFFGYFDLDVVVGDDIILLASSIKIVTAAMFILKTYIWTHENVGILLSEGVTGEGNLDSGNARMACSILLSCPQVHSYLQSALLLLDH